MPITAAERAAHLANAVKQMESMLGRESGGRGPIPKVEAEPPAEWAAEQPAIISARILVDSRHRAWVQVVDADPSAGDRYDLLDTEGRLVDAVRLPRGTRLVGMGKGVLYATREDADGLLFLRRHALP